MSRSRSLSPALRALLFHPRELLQEWATRRNRPSSGEWDPGAFLQLWSEAGDAGPGRCELPALEGDSPELLVVVMTYGRPAACTRLLEQLQRALAREQLAERAALLVLHDACGADYDAARTLASRAARTSCWLDARRRIGKREFWKSYQTAFLFAQRWRPRHTLFLHDDLEFEPDLLGRARVLWQQLEGDPQRRVLYLLSSSQDEPQGRWVQFQRRELPHLGCRLTSWFDLQAFFVDLEFFELLQYRMIPIHYNRWKRKPTSSSGVGRQLTLRLQGRAHVYQAWPPLVCHGAEASIANPEARRQNDFDNRADYIAAEQQRLIAARPGESPGSSPRPS